MHIKTKIVSSHTADSKPVKQEVNGTMILPSLVFPAMLLHSKPVVMKLAALDAYGVKLVSYIASFHSLKKPFQPSLMFPVSGPSIHKWSYSTIKIF